jgi:P pilus assembly chaperone PapD
MKKIILLLITSKLLCAINLMPMTETVDSKKKKNIVFQVSNPSKEPVAVDFSVLKVVSTKNNHEERVATHDVQAYPTQFILAPKETKSVRVRYMGSKLPSKEEVYRVIAQELDIDVSDKKADNNDGKVKAQIKMRFSYEGLIFVHKEDAKPELHVTDVQKSPQGLQLNIANQGTSSALPNSANYDYFAQAQGKEYKLTENDLKGAEFRRVLAGANNHFTLPNIQTVSPQIIDNIRLEKKR